MAAFFCSIAIVLSRHLVSSDVAVCRDRRVFCRALPVYGSADDGPE